MRLVDADMLDFTIHDENPDELAVEIVKVVKEDIDKLQTIDAVPVVRCKDCKYKKPLERCFDRKGNQLYYCDNDYGLSAHLKEDFFCCFGARKDSVNEDNI